MITLTPGRTLTAGDLYLLTRDANGAPITPNYIAYTLFLVQGTDQVLMSAPRSIPATGVPGSSYVAMTIPTSWADGTYRIVWYLKELVDSVEQTVTEDFAVQSVKPGFNLEAPSMLMIPGLATKPEWAPIIRQVRELLSDTNPDRNYHFRPPTAAKTVANFSQRVGFIWTDPTIIVMLQTALSRVNSANPKAMYGFTLDTLQEPFTSCACLGAAALCLSAEGCRWVADEFGYSLNGVSLDLQKSQSYMAMSQVYTTAFEAQLPALTANRPMSAGLRQYKWLR